MMAEIDFTIFGDRYGMTARRQHASLEELAAAIRDTVAIAKEALPLVKFGTFGSLRTPEGCLRHDVNVLTVSGVEGDYDGGEISFEQAVEIAEKAGLRALIYTSPSYTPQRPRWRVVAPFSGPLPPEMRAHNMGRLNGLYDGIFAVESWTLSQSYFFGRITGNPGPLVAVIDGMPIDRLDELDRIWRGKPNGVGNGAACSGRFDEQALLAALIGGENYHRASVSLVGKWAYAGVSMLEAQRRLTTAFECVFPPDRDARWHSRFSDIPRIVQGIYGSEADKRDRGERVDFQLHSTIDGVSSPNVGTATASEARPDEAADQPAPGPAEDWPQPLGLAAYHGLAGEIVIAIEPHTEVDPAAILFQLLVAYGSSVGHRAYFLVESTRHYPNLFTALVGKTAKARKGTSWRRVRYLFEATGWAKGCITSGLSSGEGLIHRVRDQVWENHTDKKTGKQTRVVTDEGVEDKRLLVIEEEMARPLRAMARPENILSAVLRDAWDGSDLSVMTRRSPLHASDPHISIIAHVTKDDLLAEMDMTSTANGFGNRFLFCCIRRSKLLPLGGRDDRRIAELAPRLVSAIQAGSMPRRVCFDIAAEQLWVGKYAELAAERLGMYGAITARGEAQVIRLALIYALLDNAPAIGVRHLEAGLEVWRYADESARCLFGDKLGDRIADAILAALRMAGATGMTRTQIRELFSHATPASRIDTALGKLATHKLARTRTAQTAGRPVTVWLV